MRTPPTSAEPASRAIQTQPSRRKFLRSAAMSAGALALPTALLAAKTCGTALDTPLGPVQKCTAGIDSLVFQGAYRKQRADEWCWAACISMVFNFYNHPIDQQRIVFETWGQVVNMPARPYEIFRDLNRAWKDDHGRTFQSTADIITANNVTAISDLLNNQPLIIGARGHATVLTAITSVVNTQTGDSTIVEAVVRDPWPTSLGKRALRPEEWANIAFAARIRVT